MRAIVTGANGQDGRLITELLLENGFEVLKLVQPSKMVSVEMEVGIDICDRDSVDELIKAYIPDHVYHLAARHTSSDENIGSENEAEMLRTNFISTEVLLRAISRHSPLAKFIYAGSSQMYSKQKGLRTTIDETTLETPTTFYGHTKKWSRELISHYKITRSLHASTGILFNHESIFRREAFLTRKISIAVAKASQGHKTPLLIQNDLAEADWSDARDVVAGMHLALMAHEPSDFVFASGRSVSVRELVSYAYSLAELNWKDYVSVGDSRFDGALVGDSSRANAQLKWHASKNIYQVIEEMIKNDVMRQRALPESS